MTRHLNGCPAILALAATLSCCVSRTPTYEQPQVPGLAQIPPGKIGFVNTAGGTPGEEDAMIVALSSPDKSGATVIPLGVGVKCEVTSVLHMSQPDVRIVPCANVRTLFLATLKLPPSSHVVVLKRAASKRTADTIFGRLTTARYQAELVETEGTYVEHLIGDISDIEAEAERTLRDR